MSTVLITGAGGFVGGRLALGLARLGFRPVVQDVSFDEAAARLLAPFPRLTGDLRAVTPPASIDYLIHGAAVTAHPAAFGLSTVQHLALNTSLSLAALELAERLGVRRTVLLSSAGVFSPWQRGPLDERAQPDAQGSYATAKRLAEQAAENLRASGVLDSVSVRLGNIYGPTEVARSSRPRLSLVGRMAAEARRARRITLETPTAVREWTFADDLAGALARVLTAAHLPAATLHLCNPEISSDAQLAAQLAARLAPDLGPIEVVTQPTLAPVRPPLASRYDLGLPAWTPLTDGLAQTLRREMVPT